MSVAWTPESVTAAHIQRMREVDPLVAGGAVPERGSGVLIDVDGALGVYKVIDTDPESVGATWSELRRHSLSQIRLAGANPAVEMRRLLGAWRERLTDERLPQHGESTAAVSWASRDAQVVKVLRDSGFTATATLAARVGPARPGPKLDGATVRAIEPRDASAVVALHEALIRWDDCFGGAHWRASTRARMRDFVAELIASPSPRSWVAEVGGEVVGSCDVEWRIARGAVSVSRRRLLAAAPRLNR